MELPSRKRVVLAEWMLVEQAGMIGPLVGVDFETFYSSAYSVSQMGNYAYTHDRRFDAWAVSVSDGERTCVCPPAAFPWGTIAGREWVSHNREFDEAVFGRLKVEGGGLKYGDGPSKWHCSAALCAFLQLPRDLAGAARAVFGVDLDKSARTRAKGRDCSPDLFGQSAEDAAYAATDAEMALEAELQANPVRFFKTVVMPLLPREAKLAIDREGVIQWRSLLGGDAEQRVEGGGLRVEEEEPTPPFGHPSGGGELEIRTVSDGADASEL